MNLGKTCDMLTVGESASLAKTISEYDIYSFAGITGDFNPLHVNEAYARQTTFKGRIAHGALVTGLAAGVLGTALPGLGAVAISQSFRYLAPVRIGDTVTVTVTVRAIDVGANRVAMDIVFMNQDGRVVSDGEVLVAPPRARERQQLTRLLGLPDDA